MVEKTQTTLDVPEWALRFVSSMPKLPGYIENRMRDLIRSDDFMTYERAYAIARGEYDAKS